MIAIRPARRGDAAAIAAIYAPHVLDGIASFETEAPDAQAMAARMAASGGRYPWLVAADGADAGADAGGRVAGYAYATAFRDRPAYRHVVETTVYVAAAATGRGVGGRLYGALIDALRAQGFVSAIGVIALPNAASVRLHERVGFRRAGLFGAAGFKHGRWIDVGYWQCALNAPRVPPVEPRLFGAADG